MIHIFQRHCNFSSQSANKPRPDWFDREKIFDHFIKTLDSRTQYLAFHDSGNGSIEDHFLSTKKVENVSIEGGNDAKAFQNLLYYVYDLELDDEDIVYFVEDDYLHTPGWIDVMLDGFENIDTDYMTLYDHPDKYYAPGYQALTSKVIATKSCHWRTTPSTTNTYAFRYKTFLKHFDIHMEFCDMELKYTRDHDKFVKLWNEGSNLISSVPGYSTHVELPFLSPVVDWKRILES